MLPTLYLNVLYGLLHCTALTDLFRITEVQIAFCAVRTESLYKTDTFRPLRVKIPANVLY